MAQFLQYHGKTTVVITLQWNTQREPMSTLTNPSRRLHKLYRNNFINSCFGLLKYFVYDRKKWHVLPNEVQSQPYYVFLTKMANQYGISCKLQPRGVKIPEMPVGKFSDTTGTCKDGQGPFTSVLVCPDSLAVQRYQRFGHHVDAFEYRPPPQR